MALTKAFLLSDLGKRLQAEPARQQLVPLASTKITR